MVSFEEINSVLTGEKRSILEFSDSRLITFQSSLNVRLYSCKNEGDSLAYALIEKNRRKHLEMPFPRKINSIIESSDQSETLQYYRFLDEAYFSFKRREASYRSISCYFL